MRQFLPTELVAGTTWEWSLDLPDYDPALWTLSIFLRGQGIKIDAVAVADNRAFKFSVAAADTDVTPGLAGWQAKITDGVTVAELGRGTVTILRNLEKAGEDYDARSDNQQILDSIKALIHDKAAPGRLPIEYMVAGRQFRFQAWEDLLDAEDVYTRRVNAEKMASGDRGARSNMVVGTFGSRDRLPAGDRAIGTGFGDPYGRGE